MTQPQEISCGLDFTTTNDLQACLSEALHCQYSFIIAPIVHPRFRRHYVAGADSIGGFTRSDMVLSPQDWTTRIVAKVSPYLNVDSQSPVVRRKHEDTLNEELAYCRGLCVPAVMLSVHGRTSNNLARILMSFFESNFHPILTWVHVPMLCNRTLRASQHESDDERAWNETWHWWSRFHELLDWDRKVGVVLELSADLPSDELLLRWLGEPVKAIILPTSIFYNNKKGYPVLSKAHQDLVVNFVERDAQVIVSGARRSNVEFYMQYVTQLWNKRLGRMEDPMLAYARGWEDYLQTPLQPLADNLDTHTYNVFEKDPIKYDQYQKAIVKALLALQKDRENENDGDCDNTSGDAILKNNSEENQYESTNMKPITVMVLGAGRGPLVRATFNAADITKSNVRIVAVEKNPCAVVVLAAQLREVWRDRDVTLIPGDMRYMNLSLKADIIVSELLGSWGDNELSPECLDGASSLLKSGGISIPCQYRSYAAPISSPRLWGAAKVASMLKDQKDKNLETLWVVYMQNKHSIDEPKQVFVFNHPAKGATDHEGQEQTDYKNQPLTDSRRSETIEWVAKQDNVIHGFGGYFDCTLFADEMISILPSTHSPGMISWFPVFIPLRTPLRVSQGEHILATFWRCRDSRRVWYEWMVRVGERVTPIHNPNGRSSEMLL